MLKDSIDFDFVFVFVVVVDDDVNKFDNFQNKTKKNKLKLKFCK